MPSQRRFLRREIREVEARNYFRIADQRPQWRADSRVVSAMAVTPARRTVRLDRTIRRWGFYIAERAACSRYVRPLPYKLNVLDRTLGTILLESFTHPSAVPGSGRRSLVASDDLFWELTMASPPEPIHTCWICGNRVSLEKCKIDEHGQAVHEDCYVAKIAFQIGNTPQSPNPA